MASEASASAAAVVRNASVTRARPPDLDPDLIHGAYQRAPQLRNVDRGGNVSGYGRHRNQVPRTVRLPLVMLQLDSAQYLVSEPDGIDQKAAHVGDRCVDAGVMSRVFDQRRCLLPQGLPPNGLDDDRGIPPIGPTECPAVREDRRRLCYPVDPEVSPVEQPMRQPLYLAERFAELRVSQDGALELVDLVQVFRRDCLFQNALGEQSETAEHQQYRDPSRRSEQVYRRHHDYGTDQREQVGNDFPAKNQALLRRFELVPNQQREVEQSPSLEEVDRSQREHGREQVRR